MKKAISFENLKLSTKRSLNKSVAMATPVVTVNWKLFQMEPYIIVPYVRKLHYCTTSRFGTARGGGAPPAWTRINCFRVTSANGFKDVRLLQFLYTDLSISLWCNICYIQTNKWRKEYEFLAFFSRYAEWKFQWFDCKLPMHRNHLFPTIGSKWVFSGGWAFINFILPRFW